MVVYKAKAAYYLMVVCFTMFWLTVVFTRTNVHRLNLHGFIVQSQSMEPVLSSGSLIITKSQSDYVPGDIVTFTLKDNPDKNTITHRIFKIVNWKNQPLFITKGDVNTVVDSQLISREEIIGKVIYQIPYLGMFVYTAQNKIGSLFYIIIPAFIIIFIEVKNIFKALKSGK